MHRIALLIPYLFLTACALSTGYSPDTSYSGIRHETSRVQDVYLFYPGTPVPGEFQQLGLVSATGDSSSSDRDVISHLKMKALNIGADALIAVNRHIEPREAGLIFDDERDNYNAIAYQGTAIRFNDIETLPEHIKTVMASPDYSAQTRVNQDKESSSNSTMFELFLSLVLGIAYLVTL
ncbi:MAG: hypothetical protein HWE18_02865 [Gammaproteobacteria bacterium]|nr:hypothetical protein [Gammaproteobacteria bacterium]